MKTRFALASYYISIGFLVIGALVIIAKLMLWPPCTQTGSICVIEPWSVAGLAGTVLAVAATVLAILGAVAVAAWWTSLNDRVNEQVQKLYKEQSEAVNTRIDYLVVTLEGRVHVRLEEFQKTFDQLHEETEKLKNSLEVVRESTSFVLAEQKQLYKSDSSILEIFGKFLEGVQRGDFVITPTNHDDHNVGS